MDRAEVENRFDHLRNKGMIAEQIDKIKKEIPTDVTLIAVSKLNPIEKVMIAYDAEQRVFGENRVQELLPKYEAMPKDIQWHLIGHLQTNKVKYIAPFISMIHSIDSLKLLREVDKEAKKNNRTIRVLLQFHVAQEATKYGLSLDEASEMLQNVHFKELKHIRVVGIMGMATQTEDWAVVRNEFRRLKAYFREIKSQFFDNQDDFKEISMGMSHDYPIAIEEGSTMIRVGSKIFK